MSLGKRLHKIETSLTTKQAILLWVKRVPPFDEEYRKNELWARMPERVRKRISGMVIAAAFDGLRKREPLGQEAFAITLAIAHRRNLELLLMGLDWMEEQHE